MDSNAIDWTRMCFVMLNNFLSSDIVHRDVFRFRGRDHTLLKRMEDCFRDRIFKTIILLDALFTLNVPNHDFLVLASWNYRRHIVWKVWCAYPIGVTNIWAFEFKSRDVPNLYTFVVTWREDQIGIGTETYWSYWSSMSFYCFGLCCCAGVPKFY